MYCLYSFQSPEVVTESDEIRRADRQEVPDFGDQEPEAVRPQSHAEPEPEGEQQVRQLRSEPAPEPVRASPAPHPAHKYEQANYREPVKMPQVSQEPNPIIR
jgi:hypothetical protein